MSHPENSTTTQSRQDPKTTHFNCGGMFFHTGLICVSAGFEPDEALNLARKLGNGIESICKRLHDQTNMEGELATIDEIAAVGVLGGLCGALVASASRGLKHAQGGDQ
ncbi:hypothetical protein [Metapseudomonas otitidis]|uniref:hypothetical protein n=1 Tax=Metapseudomonas otitidis TaxID=319939 RepID=UPI0013F5A9CD|nr:hypothetical protein [Pseudomonas otitidis]